MCLVLRGSYTHDTAAGDITFDPETNASMPPLSPPATARDPETRATGSTFPISLATRGTILTRRPTPVVPDTFRMMEGNLKKKKKEQNTVK